MLTRSIGTILGLTEWDSETQQCEVRVGESASHQALNYVDLTGAAQIGDTVLLNTTARVLSLGTGGFDFVLANLTRPTEGQAETPGHLIKGRYLPCQQSVLTLEEQVQHAALWDKTLEGTPVLVGQLHSQIGPAAAALWLRGYRRVVYTMTDVGALPIAFSRLVRELKAAGFLSATVTCGQAFGGDCETVTVHSALLAARHLLQADAILVCQGPGNAGTGTRYGFGGIEQAQNLDIVSRLGGTAYAIARMSSSDSRARHRGISHHTRTSLGLAYAPCIVGLPPGTDASDLPAQHTVVYADGTDAVRALLAERGLVITTMGRTWEQDPAFFESAAAAGLAVPCCSV